MAVTVTHGSYKFTISTPSAITVTEAGINTYFKSAYVPTVKRNKSGTAITRYIFFELQNSNTGHEIAIYKAVFTKTGTTATVTAYSGSARMGDIANDKLEDGMNRLQVMVANSISGDADGTDIAMTINVNLYPTITLSASRSQGSPSPGTFGYIKGFCTGSVTATIKKTWTYTGGSVTVPISSSSLTGNGRSASGTSGTSLTLSLGTLNATSITVSATAKNSRGLTASASITVTCQDYKAPLITQLTAVRDSGNEQNANITVKYSLHSTNQLGTTGAIKANYSIKSGGTTIASGSGTICASGTSLGSLTGTLTIPVTGSLLDPDTNYDLTVTITDRVTTGGAAYDVITSTFRLIHVNANGKGIGVFGAAPASGLKIYDDVEVESINGVAPVFGSATGGAGASSLTFTNAACIGKRYLICTAMDVDAAIVSAKFVNKISASDIRSTDGKITVYFDRTLSVATRVNYIAW